MLSGNLHPVTNMYAVEEMWPQIEPLLDRVADEKVTLEDIYRFVMEGRWMLWVIENPDSFILTTVIITEFIEYPQVTNLRIIFLSGDDEDWAYGIHVLEDFARVNKCHTLEVLGRKGWERVLRGRGYKLNYITLGKRIL
jgi:hypothetical protein